MYIKSAIIWILSLVTLTLSAQTPSVKITINADQEKDTISRHIYGHFAEHLGRCIYGGFYVGEDK